MTPTEALAVARTSILHAFECPSGELAPREPSTRSRATVVEVLEAGMALAEATDRLGAAARASDGSFLTAATEHTEALARFRAATGAP
jgi:hypothetical protein